MLEESAWQAAKFSLVCVQESLFLNLYCSFLSPKHVGCVIVLK